MGRFKKSEVLQTLPRNTFIAVKSGLGNTTTARDAELVVDHGIPAVVEAMDRKEIGVETAAVIAREPEPEQAAIITLPIAERRSRIKQLADKQKQQRAVVNVRSFERNWARALGAHRGACGVDDAAPALPLLRLVKP